MLTSIYYNVSKQLFHPFESPFIDDEPLVAANRYRTWFRAQVAFAEWTRRQLRHCTLHGTLDDEHDAVHARFLSALVHEQAGFTTEPVASVAATTVSASEQHAPPAATDFITKQVDPLAPPATSWERPSQVQAVYRPKKQSLHLTQLKSLSEKVRGGVAGTNPLTVLFGDSYFERFSWNA